MNLKQLIRRNKLLHPAVGQPFTIPGEPLIYSIKYAVGKRRHHVQFFRNKQWASLLRCFFDAYRNVKIPVVLLVRFYVSPREEIDDAELAKEATPARLSFELCDYMLSLMEILHKVLIDSYGQIVKMDVDKFYSNKPRTVFKFLKWDHYVMLQDQDTSDTETESLSKAGEKRGVQSQRKRHEDIEKRCVEALQRKAARRAAPSNLPPKNARSRVSSVRKKKANELPASHDKA